MRKSVWLTPWNWPEKIIILSSLRKNTIIPKRTSYIHGLKQKVNVVYFTIFFYWLFSKYLNNSRIFETIKTYMCTPIAYWISFEDFLTNFTCIFTVENGHPEIVAFFVQYWSKTTIFYSYDGQIWTGKWSKYVVALCTPSMQ